MPGSLKIRKYLPDGFITGIMFAVLIAYLFPGMGSEGGMAYADAIEKYGIMILFFFYGLKLEPRTLRYDLRNWKLHLLIQCSTFVVFPVIILLFRPLFVGRSVEVLWLSVFFLASLPSTVSSSVVMVSIAKGNVPGAIFNASISGIIGIAVTPAWLGLFTHTQDHHFSFGESLIGLGTQILLPVVAGMIMHRYLGQWASRHSRLISLFDKAVILCIVYNSFSNSFAGGIFATIGARELIMLSVSVIALFFIMFEGIKLLNRIMRFSREDSITFLFCGSKKSLIHGSVFLSVLFGDTDYAAVFLVPVMIYHAFQLFYTSMIAHRYGRQ